MTSIFEVLKIIHTDWITNNKDWTRPGFRALAVYRLGNWRISIKNKILRVPFSIIYRFLFRYCRNRYGIEIPYSAKIGKNVVIEHQGCIVIHGNAIVDDYCIIRQGVTIGNKSLDKPFDAPHIGKNVNIGAGAKILGHILIGDYSSIGANAVVVKDIPPYSVVVGVPGRVIKTLKSEVED